MFSTVLTGKTSVLPSRIEHSLRLESCFLEPMIINSVLSSLPTSHPREDARVTRRQHHKSDARVSFGTGRKNLESKCKHKVM